MTMQEDINNNLYKKKKRTINWSETMNDFGNKYEGTCFLLIMLFMIGLISLLVYLFNKNPMYLVYVGIGCVVIWLIWVAIKFLKCIKYND